LQHREKLLIIKEDNLMKPRSFIPKQNFSKFLCFLIVTVFLFGGLFAGQSFGKTAKEIDASADAVMDRFYKNVKDAKEVARQAKGLLVFPSVKKGALIVGGEYGQGALRIGGKTVDYYSMISGSIGVQIGGQAKDIIIAFMSDDALKKFRGSKGWEAGVDGNVALVTLGAGESAMSAMNKDPIIAFVFDVKGLIADLSFRGAKFNKLDK
jgi:lipid-binding SYLF domain-containing protein